MRQAYRYIEERKNWMDYRGALEADLPIGSGQVEKRSPAHRASSCKKAGALWREPNVQALLQLRTLRANGHWATYHGGRFQASIAFTRPIRIEV